MLLRRIVPVALAVVLTLGVSANEREVYRWTDAEGNVHYSDRPITDEAEATGITSSTTDSSRITQAKKAIIEQDQALLAKESEAAAAAKKQTKEDERYAENCRRAKAALTGIQNARRPYVPTDDGEGGRRYLDQNEIAERVSTAQENVSEWCR